MWIRGQAKRKEEEVSFLVGARKQQAWRRASATTEEQPGQGAVGERRGKEVVEGGEEHCWTSFVDVHEMCPHHSHPRAVPRAWLCRTEDVFPGGTPGRAEERREKQKSSASELLLCAGPRARQFTDSISFNHHNNRVRKEFRLPVSSEEMEAQSKTIFPS